MLYFRFVLLTIIISFTLSACKGNEQQDNAKLNNANTPNSVTQENHVKQKVTPLRELTLATEANIVQSAYLRENLPESAFAYARIPNIWSLIGTAKNNIFDDALNAQPFVDAVNSIRAGINENVIPEIPDEDGQLLARFVFQSLTSPIEAIIIDGVDPAIPTPNVVVTASANFNSIEEIQTLFAVIAKNSPEFEVTKAVQSDGYAELLIAKMNVQFQWDKDKSRFTLLAGISLSPNNLSDLLKTFVPNPTHQMKALENTIDSSGQGTFAWANPRKISSLGSSLGKQKEIAALAVIGISSMKNIALGTGTSNGINRIKYVVEMPVTGFRSYMPIIKTTPEFNVMGKTKVIGSLGLPSRADFASIENTIALVSKAKDMQSYYTFKKEFNKALGFEIDDIFDFFGQDMSFVSDEAGSYVALRLNDAEKFKASLSKSVETLGLDYQQREIGGHTYHHLKIPSFYTKHLEEQSKKRNKPESKLLKRFLSVPSHLYWEQEDDYLILANIPQTLIDRHYIETKTSVKEWLTKKQRMNPEGSLLMVSVNTEDIAKKMYRMHLSILNYLADLVDKPIDLFALATPHEAKIPKQNSYGFKMTSSETQLAFELNYESNPLEIITGGGIYQSMVVVGILSAIAVPAYDDYTIRAKLIGGIVAAEEVKSQLNEFEIEYGRYPNQYEIADLKLDTNNSKYSIKVEENTGEITLKFRDSKLRQRNRLTLLPPKQGVSTKWRCKTRIKKKYFSSHSSCRPKY